jgi:hypothetical protein
VVKVLDRILPLDTEPGLPGGNWVGQSLALFLLER